MYHKCKFQFIEQLSIMAVGATYVSPAQYFACKILVFPKEIVILSPSAMVICVTNHTGVQSTPLRCCTIACSINKNLAAVDCSSERPPCLKGAVSEADWGILPCSGMLPFWRQIPPPRKRGPPPFSKGGFGCLINWNLAHDY